jgi:putative membrane protein
VHLLQLALSALSWRVSLGGAGLTAARIFQARWVREGVNALLPVAQIGGQVVGVRLLVASGLTPSLATAGTVLDLTLEALAQLLFTAAGCVALLCMRHGAAPLGWIGGGLAASALGVCGLIAAQRLGALRLVERLLARLAARHAALAAWSLAGLHAALMARQDDRSALLRATLLHLLSWTMGGLEVAILLGALGYDLPLTDAVIIESLAMAARSTGFAVPGAVGVQEGGFVLACGLFGVPAEPALALSLLKRLREALVGLPALAVWNQRFA